MRILIVEDEFVSRTLLAEMLMAFGKCHTATTGREAIELIQQAWHNQQKYDLVCLDIVLPEMGGQEVLAQIRRMERTYDIEGRDATKVIMTTVLADTHNIVQAFTEGHCEAYLTKPINRDALLRHLVDLKLIDETFANHQRHVQSAP